MPKTDEFKPIVVKMGKNRGIPVTYLFFGLFAFAAILLFLFHQQFSFDFWV